MTNTYCYYCGRGREDFEGDTCCRITNWRAACIEREEMHRFYAAKTHTKAKPHLLAAQQAGECIGIIIVGRTTI